MAVAVRYENYRLAILCPSDEIILSLVQGQDEWRAELRFAGAKIGEVQACFAAEDRRNARRLPSAEKLGLSTEKPDQLVNRFGFSTGSPVRVSSLTCQKLQVFSV